MNILRPDHLEKCKLVLPTDLIQLIMDHPRELVVAGGLVRSMVSGEAVADIDVFVNGSDLAYQMMTELVASREGLRPATTVHKGRNAFTIRSGHRLPVQFVYKWPFATPDALIDDFDLTVSKAALWWDGGDWQSLVDPMFYSDVASKRIRYTSPARDDEAGDGILRVLKFCARGYKVSFPSLAAVLARLMAEQRGGESEVTAYMLKKLREADDGSDVTGLAYYRE